MCEWYVLSRQRQQLASMQRIRAVRSNRVWCVLFRKAVPDPGHLAKERRWRIQLQHGLGKPQDGRRTDRKVSNQISQGKNHKVLPSLEVAPATLAEIAHLLLAYLQFHIQVCFSVQFVCDFCFAGHPGCYQALVFSCDLELWPIFFTFEIDLDKMNLNQHAKYILNLEVLWTHEHTDTPDRLLYVDH